MTAQDSSGPADPRAPYSRRVVLVAATVLGLTAVALLADGRRVRTGELLLQSDHGDVRVTIARGGRIVVGPTAKRSFTLLPGDYEIALDGVPFGRVSVVRGGRSVLRVVGPATRTTPGPP